MREGARTAAATSASRGERYRSAHAPKDLAWPMRHAWNTSAFTALSMEAHADVLNRGDTGGGVRDTHSFSGACETAHSPRTCPWDTEGQRRGQQGGSTAAHAKAFHTSARPFR